MQRRAAAAAAAEVAVRPPQSLAPSIRRWAGFFGRSPGIEAETVSAILGLWMALTGSSVELGMRVMRGGDNYRSVIRNKGGRARTGKPCWPSLGAIWLTDLRAVSKRGAMKVLARDVSELKLPLEVGVPVGSSGNPSGEVM